MNPNEYQKLCSRTSSLKNDIDKDGIGYRNKGRVIMACLGLSGETGETIDYLKKVIFHNHAYDKDKLKREIGDILWYVAEMCSAFDFSLEEIMELNISKLKARYPEGFSSEASINRPSDNVEKYCDLCKGSTDAKYKVEYLTPHSKYGMYLFGDKSKVNSKAREMFLLKSKCVAEKDVNLNGETYDKVIVLLCKHHLDCNNSYFAQISALVTDLNDLDIK